MSTSFRVSDSNMSNRIKYTREVLEPLVKQATSVAQVARLLGIPLQGGSHSHLSRTIKKHGFDTSHFTGQGHMKGKVSDRRKAPEEILVNGYTRRGDCKKLRRALLASGRAMQCVRCPVTMEYNGGPIVLEIDHVNNDWTDNRLENLQFMCPNCHSQKTKTDGSRIKFLKQIAKPVKAIIVKTEPKASNPDWRHQPRPNTRKVERPTRDELARLVWLHTAQHLSERFGVSDTMIAKWCRYYEIDKPTRGYWAKRAVGQSHEQALG